ncbi:uncharacterized protein LOC116843099 [Odontomachus brunneus]|uniref:uncharacterized protein LOC116843099 n=1 Tax=Odontomachus brunneus TaxID=486640 RepID=UPI0013F1A694|nr:uncharacterized protein LOC116843099 [Odontomachus brunneus]
MFESDDWIFEVAVNDIHGTAIQTHSQCQNKEETSSTKRRKIDDCKASFIAGNDTCETKVNATKATKDLLHNNLLDSNKNDVTREHLLLGIFQKNISQKITGEKQYPQSSKTNTSSSSSCEQPKEKKSINFTNKAAVGKEAKLIRIFPGPAGLIARMKNGNTSVAAYLNKVKELESKSTTEHIENNFSKSSQDEKNLFGEKAWKFLLDDLPRNFFNEYGISTIKSRANASHCNSMKVKFVAGRLDYIDHSHNDPFITLKDSTDSIEGIVHRDIPLNYPGVLEPNVILLLHDVGLLKTTTRVVTNKYHILVSRVNLLAVYSNKGRIIQTSRMENILSSISNIELTKGDCITPISSDFDYKVESRPTSSVNASNYQRVSSKPMLANNSTPLHQVDEKKHENCKQDFEKDNKNCEATDKIFESFEDLIDMDDDMNDVFFTIEPRVLDENKYLKHSSSENTSTQISEIQQHELQTQSSDCLENASGGSSAINLANKIKSASPVTKCNVENSKNLASYFTGKTLQDSEFDSDDEILSQLDVDNVVSNHEKDK